MFLLGFPLLIIPFAIYNIVTFIMAMPDAIWTTEASLGADDIRPNLDADLGRYHYRGLHRSALDRGHKVDADRSSSDRRSRPVDALVRRHADRVSSGQSRRDVDVLSDARSSPWWTCWRASSSASAARSGRLKLKTRLGPEPVFPSPRHAGPLTEFALPGRDWAVHDGVSTRRLCQSETRAKRRGFRIV